MSEDRPEIDPLFPSPEAPVTTEDPPPAVAPLHPELLPTLQELDQDVAGEMKFCAQAADALRAFQVRWLTDHAVEDGYASAIVALDNMASILSGAHQRATQDVTTRALDAVATAQTAEKAQLARDHAMAWLEMPPPPPLEPPTSQAV